MNRKFRLVTIVTLACACMWGGANAWAQQNGGPPGNASTRGESGKSAGVEGGAGAAGQSGTDPATLSRTEEQRVQNKNAQGASASSDTRKRKDWKE